FDSLSERVQNIEAFQERTGDQLTFAVEGLKARFVGTLSSDGRQAVGHWLQSGGKFALTLDRTDTEEKPRERKRPQTPQPPYSYRTKEVQFPSRAAGVSLAGTLTLPPPSSAPLSKRFPVVVFATGSGPQDRDETLLGHKPFLVLADHLTRNGIATLRFDDRGVGKSTGNHATATTVDFADDVLGAIEFLTEQPEIDPQRIGILGHSEGGIIGPMAAAKDDRVAFLIMLAGPAVTGAEIMAKQGELIGLASGLSRAVLDSELALQQAMIDALRSSSADESPQKIVEHAISQFLGKLAEDQRAAATPSDIKQQALEQLTLPWFRFFLTHDPKQDLVKIKIPVLALFGEKDLQVDPEQNVGPMKQAFSQAGNSHATVTVLPGLNHLFQPAQSGAPAEYDTIEQTMAPAVLDAITTWIQSLGK
ncbi:MAG: alpha/beta fold hydrolase, partial [Planctomycetales bacterium]|nr:alpha/beta fold hydrolase [Planctomycetales bacterium]